MGWLSSRIGTTAAEVVKIGAAVLGGIAFGYGVGRHTGNEVIDDSADEAKAQKRKEASEPAPPRSKKKVPDPDPVVQEPKPEPKGADGSGEL